MTSNTASGGVSGQYPNQGAYQEVVVQTRALPAEVGAGGVSVNMITKDGGNTFRGQFFATYTDQSLQAGNVSDEQARARPDRAERHRRLLRRQRRRSAARCCATASGSSPARAGSASIASRRSTFNPDGSQALDENLIWNVTGKATWQINQANRLSSFADYNYKIRDHRRQTSTAYQFVSPEASYNSPLWGPVANVKWTSTLSSYAAARQRVLLVLRAVVARLPARSRCRRARRGSTSRSRR